MKAIMIVYNQAHTSSVDEILNRCMIRGFTRWLDVQGRGSRRGEPHYGSHAWPAKNVAVLAVVEEEKIPHLCSELKKINDESEDQGLRVFSWEAESLL